MEAIAKARFVRMAPRKTRLLVALVRGMNVDAARQQLLFSAKQSATPILKVLDSAVANAKNNLKLDPSSLVVSKAWVDEGPSFFRYTPRAQGRATPIRHRMSHITLVVSPAVGTEKKVAKKPVAKKPAAKKAKTTNESKNA